MVSLGTQRIDNSFEKSNKKTTKKENYFFRSSRINFCGKHNLISHCFQNTAFLTSRMRYFPMN